MRFSLPIILYFLLPQALVGQGVTEEIIVHGNSTGELGLAQQSDSGSRLGLSLMETPATVEIIDASVLRSRGYKQLSDALQSLPGVIAGESPAAPSSFSMRGFTRSQITILRDGLWIGPANMVMRPQNTFNLEKVEVLRGPSSVLNGQGAVAGTVNTVTKSAAVNQAQSVEALASYGRYDSYQLGLGVGGALGESAWYRADISQREADGYVDRMDPASFNLTASLLWQASDEISLKLSVDYLDDELADYWGTPLVPVAFASQPMTDVLTTTTGETLDKAMRFRNYNVDDSRAGSDQLFLRADLSWQASEKLVLTNTLYRFDADRDWLNAEGFVFCTQVVDVCTQSNVIQRYYGYFFVTHDQELWGNRFTARHDQDLGGMHHRLLGGFEITDLDFARSRGFRINEAQVPGDAVDPFDPLPGFYGRQELRGLSPTVIKTRAFFIEDALQFNDRFSLVSALRYEQLDLDRQNFNAAGMLEASSFARDFDWWSWRVGAVYNLIEDLVAYAQYSNARDPVNANIFLVNAGENFDLSKAAQWELGIKAILLDGRAEATFAWYDIERDDVLERIGVDNAANVGGRTSQGFEFSATLRATEQWRIGANTAYTDAAFKRSANFVSFAGNTPPNVPEWTANIWTSYRDLAGLPLEVGASLRYVDDRFGDNANNVILKDYQLADVFASWSYRKIRITGRVNNISDEKFASWSDVFYLQQNDPGFLYANQVLLGAPRSYEISVEVVF